MEPKSTYIGERGQAFVEVVHREESGVFRQQVGPQGKIFTGRLALIEVRPEDASLIKKGSKKALEQYLQPDPAYWGFYDVLEGSKALVLAGPERGISAELAHRLLIHGTNRIEEFPPACISLSFLGRVVLEEAKRLTAGRASESEDGWHSGLTSANNLR